MAQPEGIERPQSWSGLTLTSGDGTLPHELLGELQFLGTIGDIMA